MAYTLFTPAGSFEKASESKQVLLRMFILGNAGGTIATLSIIGTTIGSSGGSHFDRSLLWVLILFLFGLASGMITRLSKLLIAQHEHASHLEDEPKLVIWLAKLNCWNTVNAWAFWVTGIMLAAGTISGLVQLWWLSK